MSDIIYCYPNSDVLINKLNIHNAGYLLHFDSISDQEMMEASINSFVCNYEKMETLFAKALKVQ